MPSVSLSQTESAAALCALLYYESLSGALYLAEDEPDCDVRPLLTEDGEQMMRASAEAGEEFSAAQWLEACKSVELSPEQAENLHSYLEALVEDIRGDHGGELPDEVLTDNGIPVNWQAAGEVCQRLQLGA